MGDHQEFDCIVIGAGVQGSFTALQLAQRKKKTLLLEQFVLPHTRGSSHGQTRIIRRAYEQDFYTNMMEESYQLWAQLEKEAGVQLYRQTGLLVMGPEPSPSFRMYRDTMTRNGVPMVTLTRNNFSQHIPGVILAEGDGAVVDVMAGVLYADRALKTTQDQFQKLGGVLRDKEKVTNIKPGPIVTVTTSTYVYQAKSLVVAAGPWTKKLLDPLGLDLPLKVEKINVYYWREKVPGSYDVMQRFPCFIQTEGEGSKNHICGLPCNEYPGMMKIYYSTGGSTDPDTRDLQMDRSDLALLQRYISRCFPGLIPEPAVIESCMYTLTPDQHFILDCHPTHNNIIIGAGFSGHGFKFGPVIGKLLCELSQGESPSYDLSPFRIRRFLDPCKSAL